MIKKIQDIFVILLLLFPSIAITDSYTDKETKLEWQTISKSEKATWNEAKKYCQKLGEYSDWYLPSLYELKSLVDYRKYNPAIKSKLIDIRSDVYWSSSKYIGRKSNFWTVDFTSGKNDWLYEEEKHYVLCVRKQLKEEK